MSSRTRRRAIRGMAIVAVAFGAPAPARAEVRLDAGDGQQLVVDSSPLRFGLRDGQGRETVASVPAGQGPAVRPPGLDGPQPLEPAGSLGGFPALGWVVGAQAGATYPLPLFTGNRLFGAELGTLVSATGVAATEPTATGARIVLTTDDPLHPTALLQVDRLPGGGVRLRATPPEGLRPVSTVFSLASPGDEGLYGLGGRKDAFDQRGRLRNVWAEEQNTGDQRVDALLGPDASGTAGADYTFPNGPQAAYYPQALLFGSRGWAAWVAQDELQRVDLAASRPDVVRWAVASTRLDLRLAGGGLEAAARSHSADVGRAPPAPDWALQPWIDVINQGEGEAAPNGAGFSGGARVKRDLEEVVARSRATGLPLGVLGVEGWQSVPDGPAFFAALRAQGLHLSAYWNPFTSSGTPAYADAVRRNVLVKDATGRPFELVNNRGGRASVVDFSARDATAFWSEQVQRSCDLGFEGWMEDFGEYVVDGMRFADGTPPETMHNRYPLLYHRAGRAAADACADRRPGMSPFFYVRAGADGAGAATQGVFPGDETTDFGQGSGLPSVVPAMLNLALGGVPAFTTDVGGYFDFVAPRTTPELLTRWAQLAAFTPIMRLHNSTSHGEAYPWSFDDATLDAYRRYARAKVRLTGVVAAGLRRAATEGTIGPVRPLMLDDPSPAARSVDDEWLLGEDLLVAPVLTEGARARDVLLPAGARWQRVTVGAAGGFVAQGEPEAGGRTVRVPAPLADIPLFERVTSATSAPATAVRVCASRRRFAIRLPAGLRAARVSVGGRRVGTRRVGGRLRAIVDLRGRPRTGVVVIVTGRARDRAVRQVRRYLTCRPRPARG